MALIGVLIATLVILFLIIFYNPFFSGTKNNPAPLEPKKIENSAEDAVNKAIDNKKLEQNQVKNIDSGSSPE